jgi:hypothetical protein
VAKKSKAVLEAENRYLQRTNWAIVIGSIANNLIRYGTFCFLFYCAYLMIDTLAGQSTTADILVRVLSDFRINNALSYALAGGFGVWGWRERRLRQKSVKTMHARIKELELAIDPQRTSSNLTTIGETNPEDEGDI